MTVTERVAYLKGLVEGLDLDNSTKEARIIKVIVEVLDDLALTVSDLEDGYAELSDQIDAVDEDLDDLEKDYYEDEDDLDDDDDDEDDEDEEDYYEVECPNCGEVICLDEDVLCEESVSCPNCGNKLLNLCDTDCDCDCHHDHDAKDED